MRAVRRSRDENARGRQTLSLKQVLAVVVCVGLGSACVPPSSRVAAQERPSAIRPASPEARAEFDRAFDLFAGARWEEAAEAFGVFIERHPDAALAGEARFRRGVALSRLERYPEAKEALRGFLEQNPTSPYARHGTVELGLVEARLGNKQDAEQILRPVMSELDARERRELEYALGEVIKEGTGTLEALRRTAERADRSRGDERARSLAELARMLDEEASFEDVVRLNEALGPDVAASPLLAAKLARVYYHLGDAERAEVHAKQALEGPDGPWRAPARQVLDRIGVRTTVNPRMLGVILPLTGRFKAFGAAVVDGINLAIRGSTAFEVVFKDSQGDPARAVEAVEELARAGAIAILGPVGTNEAAPAAVRAQELGVTMISLSRAEGVTGIGDWVFRNSLTNSAQGAALARYAIEKLGVTRAAIFAPDIESGEEATGGFWKTLEAGGGEVRGHELYDHDQTTFSAPIKRLVARDNLADREGYLAEARDIRAAEKDPYRRRRALEDLAKKQAPVIDFDVLLLPDYWRTATLIVPALAVEDIITNACDERELERIRKTTKRNIRPVTLLGTAGWNNPNLVTRGGRFVTCSVFVDGFYAGSERDATRRFVEAFVDEYARQPNLLEAQGYDTARIARSILLDARPQTRDAFRDALRSIRKFPGVTGDTTFTADGEPDKPLFFLTVDRTGTIVELSDVSISPYKAVEPTASTRP